MPRAEIQATDISGLNELEARGRKISFTNVVRAVEDNLRGPNEGQRAAFMQHTFAAIAELPRGYVPIYLLARAYPQYIPLAIPMMRSIGGIQAEQAEVEKRVKKLEQIEFERTHPVEYTRLAPILEEDQDVTHSIYTAIRENSQQIPLPLTPRVALPNMMGTVSVHIEQKRDKWGMVLNLESSVTRDTVTDDPDIADLKTYWGSSSVLHDRYESSSFNDLVTQFRDSDICRGALGAIPMSKSPGGKDAEKKAVAHAFTSLPEAIPQLFDGEFTAIEDQSTKFALVGQSGQRYTVQLVSHPVGDDRTVESVEVMHADLKDMPSVSHDYLQFQRDLQDQLQVANGVLSWLYQYSRTEPGDGIHLEKPNQDLLDWLLDKNLLEVMTVSGTTFDDLGGYAALHASLRADTDQFIGSYRRELGTLKPENIILSGVSGIGKTALENAMASELLRAEVPVFVLNGHAFSKIASTDRQRRERRGRYEEPEIEAGISNLKKLFYFLLINGGVLLIRDFDRIIRNDDRPDLNRMMETELLPELQRLWNEPSTWLIADTEHFEQIPGALVNGHRIGTRYDIQLETDPSGIEDIIWAAVRKVDKEAGQRYKARNLDEIKHVYTFESAQVVNNIAKAGGILPIQIENIVRKEMEAHKADGHRLDPDSLTDRVTEYVARREKERTLRELRQLEEMQERLAHAEVFSRDAFTLAQRLADEVLALQRGERSQGEDIERFYQALYAQDGSLILVRELLERLGRVERQVFPIKDPDSEE